jgi:hypothetical protein
MLQRIVLFGEAEKGAFKIPHLVREVPQLMDSLGNPPDESEGLFCAIQALLYKREILYFRVFEEGFSKTDYLAGLKYLTEKEKVKQVTALCLPKVGDPEILEATRDICSLYSSFLITSQKDLFDYLTG